MAPKSQQLHSSAGMMMFAVPGKDAISISARKGLNDILLSHWADGKLFHTAAARKQNFAAMLTSVHT